MEVTTIPFLMRGLIGEVTVEYGTNDDPVHWGYGLLATYAPELAKGFPVVQASVSSCPAHGYGAEMGWVQVVRYTVFDTDESVIVFDVPPQLSDTDTPYMAFGVRPTMFDAPSFVDVQNVAWSADSFLVYTPDAVLSRHLVATCGFRWGYDITDGMVGARALGLATQEDWGRNLGDLRPRFASWDFEPAWDGA
ncbi:MAG: hypothetical protein HY240_01040 [Actinobacteria bacterium]|nr:hypothetical protein [Actinomycetota bacterium]